MRNIQLFVGLGNPGDSYRNNRHNVGFQIIDDIADDSASFRNMAGVASVSSFFLKREKIILVKPQTFMNLSGRAVRFCIDFYKIPIDNVCVFHDDIDLPLGRVKIKQGGGNGGHNGLKSIDSLAGTNYLRVRIGIGRPAEKSMVVSHVLGNFSGEESQKVSDIKQIIRKNLDVLCFGDIKQLENLINNR